MLSFLWHPITPDSTFVDVTFLVLRESPDRSLSGCRPTGRHVQTNQLHGCQGSEPIASFLGSLAGAGLADMQAPVMQPRLGNPGAEWRRV